MVATARVLDEDDPPASPLWDTRWASDIDLPNFATGDWSVADPDAEEFNRGGFAATDPVTTAIILCLFTDRRRPDWLPGDATRGWHGDEFDIDGASGERAMGSLLWTLERAQMTYETARLAEHYATEALQTLVDQGVLARVEVSAELDAGKGRLALDVRCFDPAEDPLTMRRFEIF